MIVVRNTFVAKPGQASKLAKQIKEAAAAANISNVRVLTDLVGDFNQVVFEHDAANLREFEDRMREYASETAFRDKMKGYTDLYLTGKREIFTVV